MPVNMVVITLNLDELTNSEKEEIPLSREPRKGKNKWYHQGKDMRKWGKSKYIFERGRTCGIINGIAREFIFHACDLCIQREISSYF